MLLRKVDDTGAVGSSPTASRASCSPLQLSSLLQGFLVSLILLFLWTISGDVDFFLAVPAGDFHWIPPLAIGSLSFLPLFQLHFKLIKLFDYLLHI